MYDISSGKFSSVKPPKVIVRLRSGKGSEVFCWDRHGKSIVRGKGLGLGAVSDYMKKRDT